MLNALVDRVALALMPADADNYVAASERALADVAAHFGLDVAFLRHNDQTIGATILIAQWPVRTYVPDPDPIGTVYFKDADPVFAMAEHIKEPVILRPGAEPDEFQQRIEEGTAVPVVSMAAVPMNVTDKTGPAGFITTGTLGFIKYGDLAWTDDEIAALKVIATMFVHLKVRVEAQESIRRLAAHDDLTGLRNRRSLIEHLDSRLAADQPSPVAVLFIDPDQLKAVNDLLGHDTGDQVLVELSQRLGEHSSGAAFLARLGGDEIVAALNAPTTLADAYEYAEQLRETLAARLLLGSTYMRHRISIGVAVGIAGTDSVSDLLRYAEHALTVAKSAGGNTTIAFNDDLAAQYSVQTDIEVHLHDCIDNGALFLHYQPEVDLRSGKLAAMEAVARWNHPTRGPLLREEFMPIAEATNFGGSIGREVLRLACVQFQRWRRAGLAHDVMLRVKLSPAQVVTDGFTEHLAATLAQFDIPPASMCLELPEDLLVAEAQRCGHILQVLKDLGVQLALDNFGTGYSFLPSLKELPIDSLKVGRAFVQTLDRDGESALFIQSIAALADAFGLELTADGMDTESAAERLAAMGYTRAQGLLVSGPVDADGMEKLFKASTLRPPMPAHANS
ncbi:sensor domain-containing phosphodiesterase [Mycobacterium sp. CBMA293]|uniref:putative bifunctional diguanylate cyclase/phosphodiesterase n=1 Tax=unclassified Mycolicibacterium TaxID=2636767 RepID=UPI0012DD05B9|nr:MULTISPECIES: bifunctional diguanylate cyclase/phosphodiesterase [unclassified Mycolicibacterium]MUL49970.1 sensor domain-containing phosphodiesterase [Mycolicibacterium sp. CBMA 360]MUL96596.1 sensor domain-containing phosphodiesterase [Mycolicibacterium sp. CBMA 230]MUM30843.1 sensor domain-containing phosphodiesterase [Mycolicibacterium sp. CBMA 361]MUL61583.1 sensor domain-containing phosphodiesterase [Mycolicibacterium sp. CBMA 335]MUL74318.1 sensor domain-containing phosphodiesterase 